MREHGVFIEHIRDQVGDAFDQFLFLFAGYVFTRQFNFYVWHKTGFVPGLLCNSFGGDVYIQVKIIIDQCVSEVLKEVAGAEFDIEFGPVHHDLSGSC